VTQVQWPNPDGTVVKTWTFTYNGAGPLTAVSDGASLWEA
jgi:YD repeat-containing protein